MPAGWQKKTGLETVDGFTLLHGERPVNKSKDQFAPELLLMKSLMR